jgi:hypothetical protein
MPLLRIHAVPRRGSDLVSRGYGVEAIGVGASLAETILRFGVAPGVGL